MALSELEAVALPSEVAALTRAQLLQGFYLYDTDTLRRLAVLAKTILVPGQNQLLNVDFSRMVEYAHSLGDFYFPEWTDRSKSDFAEFLIELMALFSDKDIWYINNASQEGFAMSCQVYSNMVAKGMSNGVDVPLRRSASALFALEALGGPAETVARGAIEFGMSGLPEVTFTNDEFTLPAAAQQSTFQVRLFHGTVVAYSGEFNGKSVQLTDENICQNSVVLTIDGDRWVETASFKLGTPQTKHFLVLPDESGRVEIVFAQGKFGARPPFGASVTASYRIGGGLLGNLQAGTLSLINKSETQRAVVGLTQPTATTGGTEQWDIETLRVRTVTQQRTREVAVTVDDGARLALEIEDVHNAKLTVISNFVFCSVVPAGGGTPSADLLAAVESFFNNGHILLNFTLIAVVPDYVPVLLQADVYVLADQRNAGVKQLVEELLRAYLDEAQDAQFGRSLTLVELNRQILSQVTGVQNVDFIRLQRASATLTAPANVNLAPNQITSWTGTTVTINVIGGV